MHHPTLTISLSALAANYRLLAGKFTGGECAAVVKADAYGLGVAEVSKKLAAEGCNTFFVATLEEGIELRGILPDAQIYIFHGPFAGEEKDYLQHKLTPCINSVEQLKRWDQAQPFALHVDTGMSRLGISQDELAEHRPAPALLMSHLTCSEQPAHPKNREALIRFVAARAMLPGVKASLCNSGGIFLGKDWHFDLARPGCALYGITPVAEGECPVKPVVTLAAPILQLRSLKNDESVGYGATVTAKKGSVLATVQIGYADGFQRILSGKGKAYLGGHAVPLLGRVSMDMCIFDVSDVPAGALAGGSIELLNAAYTVNDMAADAGTIGYEIFTRLGKRVKRVYEQ